MASRGFPQFSDGDVEIYLSTNEKVVLHSSVLSIHSEWFKASLSDRWSSSGTNTSSLIGGGGSSTLERSGVQGSKPTRTYELRFEKDSGDGQFYRKGMAESTEMVASRTTEARLASIKAHKDMLGTLYHCVPGLDPVVCAKARMSIMLLADVAVTYGCEHVVKLHLDAYTNHFRVDVRDLCATDPVGMLEMAMKIKSHWVFTEASTNFLGASKQAYDAARPKLLELGLAVLMDSKRAAFVEKLKACELALFCMQPEDKGHQRSQIAHDFFCQWLREQITDGKGSGLIGGYGYVYHAIASDEIFTRESRHKALSDYVDGARFKGVKDVPQLFLWVQGVFTSAAKIVEPLLKQVTQRRNMTLDPHRTLTFMGIEEEELPWIKK